MKVIISVVGTVPHHPDIKWPEGWPIPRQGDTVMLPGIEQPESGSLYVRRLDWYPYGDPDDDPDDRDPFVYVLVGPAIPGT